MVNPKPSPEYKGGMGDNPEYYAGWGTLMLINAAIARALKRSGLAWCLLSIFLGPVATLLLALRGPPGQLAAAFAAPANATRRRA